MLELANAGWVEGERNESCNTLGLDCAGDAGTPHGSGVPVVFHACSGKHYRAVVDFKPHRRAYAHQPASHLHYRAQPNAFARPNAYTDEHSKAVAHCNTYPYAYGRAHAYLNAHAYRSAHCDTNADAHSNARAHQRSNPDAGSHGHAHAYTHAYANAR